LTGGYGCGSRVGIFEAVLAIALSWPDTISEAGDNAGSPEKFSETYSDQAA
jgi:hypothetical protein